MARIEKAVARILREEPAFAEFSLMYVLSRTIRIEEHLVDQLFNSSEKRLARVLLLTGQFRQAGGTANGDSQDLPGDAGMIIGATRSRVSFFMNRFRKLGFVTYNGDLQVNSSLLNVVLHD